jgi:MtrB/PioB family decaheme-associated outer membrane protein
MATSRSVRVPVPGLGVPVLLLSAVLFVPIPASAETDAGPVVVSGDVEFGGRLVWGQDDKAKFQEYRDLRDGMIGGFDLLLENPETTWWSRLRGENVGYEDQRYWLEGGRYGRFTVDMFYGELPHVSSFDALTPYVAINNGTNLLPLSVAQRDAIEAAGVITPDNLGFFWTPQELRWREGQIGAEYHAGESVLLRSSYRIQDKEGQTNWGMAFGGPGGPGSNFTSLPTRIDEQIHEVVAGTDWHRGNSSFSAEYLGSFFQNSISSVIGDNPLVSPNTAAITPGSTAPDQGRAAASPDNWAQSLMLSGSSSLPLEMPNRISGSFAYGFRRQDQLFLEHTINPRIANPALPENSLDGKVQTLLGNLVATARPHEDLGTSLRYRIYDYDNQTDVIPFREWVLNDRTFENTLRMNTPNDYTRQNADLDVDWDFAQHWTGGLGFGWEYWNRSADREVEDLHEYGPDLDFDYHAASGGLFHGGYEFRVRQGSDYDAFAPINAALDLGCAPPNPPFECTNAKFYLVRKYDEADRYVHRFDLLSRISPVEPLELTFTSNFGYTDYHDTQFGLTELLEWSAGVDLYYEIHPRVSLLGYYTYQWQQFEQDSRYRINDQPDDPLNDWNSRTRYEYHNGSASVRFAVLPERIDAEIGYLVQYGDEETHAAGVPGGAAQGQAVNWPTVNDLLQAVTASLSYKFTENVTVRTGYRFEHYDIDNFRFDNIPRLPNGAPTNGTNIFLGDTFGDYQAHVAIMSAVLHF